jgi:hypothetical protein
LKTPKFPECGDCRFFSKKYTKPECKVCGAGEFYEPRVRSAPPSDDELMNLYRKSYDE